MDKTCQPLISSGHRVRHKILYSCELNFEIQLVRAYGTQKSTLAQNEVVHFEPEEIFVHLILLFCVIGSETVLLQALNNHVEKLVSACQLSGVANEIINHGLETSQLFHCIRQFILTLIQVT